MTHPRTQVSVLIAAALALAGCVRNPVTGAREFVMMTETQEIALGRESDAEIRSQMGLYEDDALQGYVEEIGLALAAQSHRPALPWSFAVVDSPAVNAFAIPGGYIYLTRGIMAFLGDEADLAGVLGHEIGHVTARHSVQAYTRASGAQLGLLFGGIFSPAIRELERLAADTMRAAGYRLDSGGAATVGGLDAFVGTFTGAPTSEGQFRARVATIDHSGTVYLLGGLAAIDAFGALELQFDTAIRSFRPLSAAEAESVRPNRIRLYTAQEGDSWQSIAQDAGQDIIPSNTLAIMNGFPVNEQPRAGERIKIAVEG